MPLNKHFSKDHKIDKAHFLFIKYHMANSTIPLPHTQEIIKLKISKLADFSSQSKELKQVSS